MFRSDLSWGANTDYMIKRANSKMCYLKRLTNFGAKTEDIADVYIKQIRSLLEFAVPVWHHSLTNEDRLRIERLQVLSQHYRSYRSALKQLESETLFSRNLLKIFE